MLAAALLLLPGQALALQPSPQWLRPHSAVRQHVVPARHAPSFLHGGSHKHSKPAAAVTATTGGVPGVSSVINYLRVEVVRPLFVHFLIAWSTLQRHNIRRTERKKAEFEEHASRITWVGAAVNFLLAFFKLFAGITGRSAAMIADAGHSFSDLISDGLTLVALRMSALPADVDHPYGHGRFESVGSLAIGALLIGAGISFGSSSFEALMAPVAAPLGSIALWAAVASIVSKEALFRATARIGKQLNSQVLIANAWHHRSDALSSVVAVLGIAGSILGYRRLDPLAGLLVAGMVSWMGLRIAFEAIAQLTDTSDYAVVQAVESVAREVDGINSVDHIRSRSMGGNNMVDLAIQGAFSYSVVLPHARGSLSSSSLPPGARPALSFNTPPPPSALISLCLCTWSSLVLPPVPRLAPAWPRSRPHALRLIRPSACRGGTPQSDGRGLGAGGHAHLGGVGARRHRAARLDLSTAELGPRRFARAHARRGGCPAYAPRAA